MKITIIIILILLPINLFAQIRGNNKILNENMVKNKFQKNLFSKYGYFEINNGMYANLISEKHNIDSSGLKRYQSVTFGSGVTTFDYYDLSGSRLVLSLGISHQLSESFYLEVKFDYSPKTERDEQLYIFSGIPQFSFNLLNNDLKLKTGLGLFLLGVPKSGAMIFLVADAKLEYSLSKEVSIYPEIRFIPLMLTFHISYNIPL